MITWEIFLSLPYSLDMDENCTVCIVPALIKRDKQGRGLSWRNINIWITFIVMLCQRNILNIVLYCLACDLSLDASHDSSVGSETIKYKSIISASQSTSTSRAPTTSRTSSTSRAPSTSLSLSTSPFYHQFNVVTRVKWTLHKESSCEIRTSLFIQNRAVLNIWNCGNNLLANDPFPLAISG